jgi:hypothetical protein
MLNNHLSESEIQQCALAKTECDSSVLLHIEHCGSCRAKIEMYSLLFNEIKAQPEPVFAFDLSALVLKNLPETRSNRNLNNFLIFLLIFASISILVVPLYLFRKYITHMFSAIFPISMYLILLTALTILLFQSIEMFRKYKKQMNALN